MTDLSRCLNPGVASLWTAPQYTPNVVVMDPSRFSDSGPVVRSRLGHGGESGELVQRRPWRRRDVGDPGDAGHVAGAAHHQAVRRGDRASGAGHHR